MNNSEVHILQSLLRYSEWRLMPKRKTKKNHFPQPLWCCLEQKSCFLSFRCDNRQVFSSLCEKNIINRNKVLILSETFIGVNGVQEENTFFQWMQFLLKILLLWLILLLNTKKRIFHLQNLPFHHFLQW